MNTFKLLLFMASMGIPVLAGCAEQQQFQAVEQICVPDLDKADAMHAAEETLGEMNFTIDKSDAELGFIRTRPLAGAQFFEFWRSDNVGALNSLEANLHSIRRIVQLDISHHDLPGGKPGSGGQLCIGCNVKVYRMSLPERQVSSGARAYRMFSKSTASMQRLELNPEQKKGMAWVDLGREPRLETEILKRIEKRIAIRDPNRQQAARDKI